MSQTYAELLSRVRSMIREVTPAEAQRRADRAVLIDVREPAEHALGSIPGAVVVPLGVLEGNAARHAPDPDSEVILFCEVGERSAFAALALQEMGYRNVASVAGGLRRWRREGRPWQEAAALGAGRRERYGRHLVLPEIGERGQERLLQSRVLVVGAGGLGSPAVLYLAAAGVGTLGIADDDVVEVSNLQRQIIHRRDGVGRPKARSAAEAVGALNRDVTVQPHPVRLTAGNVLDIASRYDLVVDASDNFPTRYLLNDAALHLRIPVVHGAVVRFEGQASVFLPFRGPCYRCLFPEPPPPGLAPSCREAGVLGVLPGVIGSIQAAEAIKVLLGIGEPLTGRLLAYDALAQDFRTLRVQRDPACPACSDEARLPDLVDYDEGCRPPPRSPRPN